MFSDELMTEGVERFGYRVHAFCLMTNYPHLALQAGEQPLSLIRKAKAVLQRGRLPRPARTDAGHEESTRAGEIFIKHRAIDRVPGRRYSRG